MYEQLDLFSMIMPTFKIDKPVRLIELFSGVGSQAMALRDLGADFEHYRAIEFDKFAMSSYNAIHGTDFEVSDIRNISGSDLEICDTDKFCYIMTYSFPCQDLSVAGKGKGMAKGSGTRSGLLWEVERLLNECNELPQVLLIENVPAVHSKKNMPDFQKWIDFLSRKGYSNYWRDLNAKDYGIAQNRNRTFMVSLLGEWNYKFPHPIPLKRKLRDSLEDEVDEKYYINSEKAKNLIEKLMENGTLKDGVLYPNDTDFEMDENFNQRGKVHGEESICRTILGSGHAGNEPKILVDLSVNNPAKKTISNCIAAKDRYIKSTINREWSGGMPKEILGSLYCEVSDDFQRGVYPIARCIKSEKHDLAVVEMKVNQIGNMDADRGSFENPQCGRVYDSSGLSPTINTCQGGQREPKIIVAMRGRNPDNPLDRTAGSPTEQRLELNSEGIFNTLTSVQKDNIVLESPYKIRKLTPKECWRLMDFSDKDFHKAEKVNSNSQLYKQAGNSIVRNVLVAIFSQMIAGKENEYKVMD